MSKMMAGDSDLKNYVKKYIKDLVNGKAPKAALTFSSNKDLKGLLHGTNVLGAKLNGTKLTLTIYDLYDFDINKTGNSGEAILNRAGGAAMKDGLLKPYFMLFDVTIDLKTLGFTQDAINKMKNS